MIQEDMEIINNMSKIRNLSENTRRGFKTVLKKYTKYHDMTLQELINEARQEEEQHIPLKKRKIRQRIINYRTQLLQKDYTKNTITHELSKIHTFYTHHDITVPQIPQAKIKDEYITSYEDIPNKEDIHQVLTKVPIDFKALILFMSSSGTAKAETLSLTIQDFINATQEYHQNMSITKTLITLTNQENIIPTWYIKRRKTNKFYHTFSSPESSEAIINYLRKRNMDKQLKPEDPLFPYKDSIVTKKFEQINDKMGWGKKGKYRYFSSHALRKYHASNIQLPTEYIDELQGRAKNKIHTAYIKTNPANLKQLYREHVHNVMIYHDTPIDQPENEEETNDTIPNEETIHQSYSTSYDQLEIGRIIGKLEARIEYLENRVKQLEGAG